MKSCINVIGIILITILFSSCEDKPVIPSLTTTMATEISVTTAVSGGNITDDGGAQIISGGVCWNTSDDPTIENNRTNEGGQLTSFTSNITQLAPNTTYYIRAYATNSAGTAYGKSVSFKTLGDKPSSSNLNASNITINSATINSSVNPNLLSTTVTFEYGVTSSYGSTATASQNPVNGNSNVNVTADLIGLTPGTTYHFRIKTENSLGITYSIDMTLTTLGKVPDVTIQAATNLQTKTATISGLVNPNFLSSTVTLEWGTTTIYGNTVTPSQSPVTGGTAVSVNTILTGLTPGTIYHFRIKATNELGTSNSSDMSFTTLGQVPSVTTLATNNITVSTATLNGSVNPNYLPTTFYFEWGIDNSYGNQLIPTQNSLDGGTPLNVSVVLSGLTEGTKYYYRITATNELGTTTTNNLASSFITLAKPIVTTKDISEITTTSALSGGNIISDFGSVVSESGICWSTSTNPTTNDNKVLNSSGNANFSVPVTSLSPNSVYYFRAYAINSVGIGYGNAIVLKTYTGTISDIDGNQYYTVTIGSQLWMAQNLKSTKYNNGDPIGTTDPANKDITAESNPKYQWAAGNGEEASVAIYGRVYTWHTVNDNRKLCPSGWHVATDTDWGNLEVWLSNNGYKYDGSTNYDYGNKLGKSLANSTLWKNSTVAGAVGNTDYPDYRNKSGFSALPAGSRNSNGFFSPSGWRAVWWTATENEQFPDGAWVRIMNNETDYILKNGHLKSEAANPVRCIKD